MTLAKCERILLFLTILLLPTQLGRHFWPQFSYIYSLKVDYLSPTIYFWDILAVGLLIIWILQKPAINKTALNLLLLFLFTQILSLLGTSNIGSGLVRLEQYTVAGLFGVFLASWDFKSLSQRIYLPLALGILGESLMAILQFIKGGTLGFWILGERTFTLSTPGIAKFDFYGQQFLRPYATFPHPNVLAGYVLVALLLISNIKYQKSKISNESLPAASSGVSRKRDKFLSNHSSPQQSCEVFWFNNKFLVAANFLGMAAIFLAMSRTVILAGLVTAVILLKRKWIIFIIIITFILSPILFTRFAAVFSFDILTILRREELMINAWQMFLKSPVFGIGLNNFIPAMASQLVTGPSRFLQPVHNIFLLALSETGLIGLIGLISLIGFPFLSSLPRVIARGKLQQGSINNWYRFRIKSGMTIAWVIIFFLGMFDHYFLTLPQGYRVLFLIWGLSLSMLK